MIKFVRLFVSVSVWDVPSFISSENVKRASDDEPCTSLYLLVKSDSFLSAFQGTPVFAAKCSAVLRHCYSMRISISWRWLDRSNMAAQLTYLRTVNASSRARFGGPWTGTCFWRHSRDVKHVSSAPRKRLTGKLFLTSRVMHVCKQQTWRKPRYSMV